MRPHNLFKQVFQGFRTACIWAWPDEEDCVEKEWSTQSALKLARYVRDFINDNKECILSMLEDNESEYYQAEEIGQDLYFNSDGHGVGFWEQEESKSLDEWCKNYLHNGSVNAYIGDDSKIYIDGLNKFKR